MSDTFAHGDKVIWTTGLTEVGIIEDGPFAVVAYPEPHYGVMYAFTARLLSANVLKLQPQYASVECPGAQRPPPASMTSTDSRPMSCHSIPTPSPGAECGWPVRPAPAKTQTAAAQFSAKRSEGCHSMPRTASTAR